MLCEPVAVGGRKLRCAKLAGAGLGNFKGRAIDINVIKEFNGKKDK
jgi:hypothetical protein